MITKLSDNAKFLIQFSNRMAEETDLERRETRIKKSLEYGKKTFQLIAKEDEAKVAWALSRALKNLPKKPQHEILKLIVNRDLRKLTESKIKKSENPGEPLREALERLEEDTTHLSKKNQKNALQKLKEVEKNLEDGIKEKLNFEEPNKKFTLPEKTLKQKLTIIPPHEPKVNEDDSKKIKKEDIKTELERAQIMVKEIIATKIAEELDVEEKIILHKLDEEHWISAPIAALSKTITVNSTQEQIEDEVTKIVEWIEDNLLEGIVEDFKGNFETT